MLQTAAIMLVFLLAALRVHAQGNPFTQPTESELRVAIATMRADSRFPPKARIITTSLAEPSKKMWYDSSRRGTMPREIKATIFDASSGHVYEFTADVRSRSISEVKHISNAQPLLTKADYDSSEAIIRRWPRFNDAMKKLGISPADVSVETWASGIPSAPSQRMVRAIFYIKHANGVNRYDRPIEGMSALIDLTSRSVKEWREVPRPEVPNATATYMLPSKPEPPVKSGLPTPTMVNGEVQWNSWRFTPMIHAREGLTLYDIRFVEKGVARRIAWRISLSEMLVPYGDTAITWIWRNAFDVGEYGFGHSSAQLRKGADVPENTLLRSASFVDDDGTVVTKKDVLAVYERDAGIGYRHAASATNVSSRHARELVVQHAAAIANYDYIVSYIFALDGTITVDVGLTGLMLVKGASDTVYDEVGNSGQMYAHFVAPNVLAPTHQHFFSFRLDMDVDDTANVVTEMDLRSPPSGRENRYGNAIMTDEWDIRSEREGVRDVSVPLARTWRVRSKRTSAHGIPSAYTLVPGATALPFLSPQNYVRKRAQFIEHQLFVTRFSPSELYAAGAYPNQSEEGKGLPQYMENDDRLIRRDVVLWYTMGVNHLARPEDWPIMPTAHASFKLVPTGFFERNPIMETQGEMKKR